MLTGLKNKRLPAVFFMLAAAVMCVFALLTPHSTCGQNSAVHKSEQNTVSTFYCQIEKAYELYLKSGNPLDGVYSGVCPCCGLPFGCNGSSGVYLCDDGYLVNKPVDYQDRFFKNIDIIKRFAELVDVKVNVMIAPQAGYILENKLPEPHMKYDDAELITEAENKLDGTNINFIRIDGILKSCAEDLQVCYRTDHHWTSAGAYTAYCRFCEANGLAPTPESGYTITKYGGFYGSVRSRNPVKSVPPDEIEIWQSQKSAKNISVEIEENEKTAKSDTPFFAEHIDDGDKYAVFLDGNHSLVRIKNTASNGGKLLIVRDSFAQALAPFLADNYSEIIMVDMRYYKRSVLKLIDNEAIDEVLFMYSMGVLAKDTDIAWCIR